MSAPSPENQTPAGGDPSHRRGFFREALGRIVSPLADQIEKRMDLPLPRTHLRPPGAIEERAFLETCYRCGVCVNVCPVNAITQIAEAGAASGTPAIDPDMAACALCNDLACTANCPSHALQHLVSPYLVRMGKAEVYGPVCLRTGGEGCTVCVDECPVAEVAISITTDGPPAVLPGCTGCGLCQFHCPTSPKAIVVKPS